MTNLKARALSAVVLGAVVLGATFAGGLFFTLVTGAIALVVWSEWVDIACPSSDDRLKLAGYLIIAAIVVASMVLPNIAMIIVLVVAVLIFAAGSFVLGGGAWAVGGLVYAAATFIAMTMLRESGASASGLIAILFLFAAVWATDIGAYFSGRHFGGPKIWPAISPNKTWSGGIGGIVAAMIAATLLAGIAGTGNLMSLAFLAIALSLVSQAGDFFESWIKRRNGVKDSGTIIPGHGGIMDRIDGLVFAAIALWLMCLAASGSTRPSAAFF
jgi:phosphatidate cytidylyltransferase